MESHSFLYILLHTVWKIGLPLFLFAMFIGFLPQIIGGILGFLLGLMILPFQLLYLLYRDKKDKRHSSNQNTEYHKEDSKVDQESEVQNRPEHGLYSLLGVRSNATKEEIRTAFKAKMMMNHPDKLATLDPELQKIATERTVAIKDAYERLSAQSH